MSNKNGKMQMEWARIAQRQILWPEVKIESEKLD